MNAVFFFFEANILGFDFFFEIKSELLKFSRPHVDRSVFLNDQNCSWQSICSEEIVHRASFSDRIFFEVTSGTR